MTVTSYLRRLLTVVAFIGSVVWPLLVAAQDGSATDDRKIDSALRASLASDAATQRVIISVASDAQASLVSSLTAHGDVVKNVHRLVGAVSAEVHSGDVRALARYASITGISSDGLVRANGSTAFLGRR